MKFGRSKLRLPRECFPEYQECAKWMFGLRVLGSEFAAIRFWAEGHAAYFGGADRALRKGLPAGRRRRTAFAGDNFSFTSR